MHIAIWDLASRETPHKCCCAFFFFTFLQDIMFAQFFYFQKQQFWMFVYHCMIIDKTCLVYVHVVIFQTYCFILRWEKYVSDVKTLYERTAIFNLLTNQSVATSFSCYTQELLGQQAYDGGIR